MDEKRTAAPRVTTFERPTRRYTTGPVRVYQASPSANHGGNVDKHRPFDPSDWPRKRVPGRSFWPNRPPGQISMLIET